MLRDRATRGPPRGIPIAVGTKNPYNFGIAGESFENPVYLDKMVDTLGGESIPGYEKKVQCCGGALAFSEPEKSQEMVKGIIEAAYDHGADLIATPCPVCQMNVEVYQDQINATYATKFAMPMVYYRPSWRWPMAATLRIRRSTGRLSRPGSSTSWRRSSMGCGKFLSG